MNIRILHMVEGARSATGLTVIIDVFRAFTVETYLMRNNASRIIPVGDVQIAFDYKREHPDTILCGERKGVIIEGFHYGNSPSQLEHVDLTGKTVMHTTSAGTQGIANAIHADEIITGSLVNARAIAEYIKRKNPENVSLVCMGLNLLKETEEDTLCANYIKSLLEDRPLPDIYRQMYALRYTSGAKFFDPEKQSVFPQRDFDLCCLLNTVPFVLRLRKDPDFPYAYMERVDVPGSATGYPEETAETTKVYPGDMISKFTREEVINFPEEIKAALAYGFYEEPTGSFDAALVLGGKDYIMESRAKAAADLYHSGQAKLFIPTGGVPKDSPFGYLNEAEILAHYMMGFGVPESCILLEAEATTTVENMTRSRKMLADRFGDKKISVAVVTSYFHVVRSVALAKAYLPNAQITGVRGEYLFDSPEEYRNDPDRRKQITTECRCLWENVVNGVIPDFPVL